MKKTYTLTLLFCTLSFLISENPQPASTTTKNAVPKKVADSLQSIKENKAMKPFLDCPLQLQIEIRNYLYSSNQLHLDQTPKLSNNLTEKITAYRELNGTLNQKTVQEQLSLQKLSLEALLKKAHSTNKSPQQIEILNDAKNKLSFKDATQSKGPMDGVLIFGIPDKKLYTYLPETSISAQPPEQLKDYFLKKVPVGWIRCDFSVLRPSLPPIIATAKSSIEQKPNGLSTLVIEKKHLADPQKKLFIFTDPSDKFPVGGVTQK